MIKNQKRNSEYIFLLRVIILYSVILLLEIFKLFHGEKIDKFIIDALLFINMLLCSQFLIGVSAFLILVYQGFDVVCYNYYSEGINHQFIMNLDIRFAFLHLSSLFSICVLVILSLIFAFLPIKGIKIKKMSILSLFSMSMFLILLFPFGVKVYTCYNPLKSIDEFIGLSYEQKKYIFERLDKFYETEMTASFINNSAKRNIIMMEVESMEKGTLGIFNSKYKEQMPFMSQLYMNSTSIEYVPKSPFSDWSVASLFATQCNLPLMVSNPNAQGYFHLYKKHRCIGDYLRILGYNLLSVETGFFVGNFAKHLKMHHWKVYDKITYRDTETFQYIIKHVFPKLSEPFALHISNTDTHHYPNFKVDKRCKIRVPKYPIALQCFDCFDQIFEKFYKEFQKSKFARNTELIIYSDHPLLSSVKNMGIDNRSLTIIIPTRPKKIIAKKASIYDITPTFLDLIGVKIEPPFIFGESLLSDKIGIGINTTFVKYLYEYYDKEFQFDGKLSDYKFNQRGIKYNTKLI